jgi:hypothetical protein
MHAYRKLAVTAALVMGVGAGSYGIASAASGSGSSTASPSLSAAGPNLSAQAQQPSGRPWGQQRSDETLLTGDTKAKVEAAATAKLPGATIVRTETDADGNAAYEVHMVQADGTPATVYVDKSFGVVKVETGMPGGHSGPPPAQQAGSA